MTRTDIGRDDNFSLTELDLSGNQASTVLDIHVMTNRSCAGVMHDR